MRNMSMRFLLCNHSEERTWEELPGDLHQKTRKKNTRTINTYFFIARSVILCRLMIIHNLRIMKKKIFALISYVSVVFITADAQCPERDFLTNRIIFLRDSSRIPPKDQLPELLSYLNKINSC